MDANEPAEANEPITPPNTTDQASAAEVTASFTPAPANAGVASSDLSSREQEGDALMHPQSVSETAEAPILSAVYDSRFMVDGKIVNAHGFPVNEQGHRVQADGVTLISLEDQQSETSQVQALLAQAASNGNDLS